MFRLDLTLPTPAENLALDEALLESAEVNRDRCEIVRVWEPRSPFVVLGRSSPIEQEVNLSFCRAHSLEVLRRSSGGQTVLAGPGCLMYCVLIGYEERPELKLLDQAHLFVMSRIQAGLKSAGIETRIEGTSDLTINHRKVSGNSLRCKRDHFIYHGTLLYDLPIDLIQSCLRRPVRKPDYRQEREHHEFLTTIPLSGDKLRSVIWQSFGAEAALESWPEKLTQQLVRDKYSKDSWNRRH